MSEFLTNTNTVRVGTYNILASGMCTREFVSPDGDAKMKWSVRRDAIMQVLLDMLTSCDVVVTQENDHFYWILHHLQQQNPSIMGVFGRKRALSGDPCCPEHGSTNRRCSMHSDMEHYFMEDEHVPSEAAEYFQHNQSDRYLSDDGIGIYYNTSVVRLKSVILQHQQRKLTSDLYDIDKNNAFLIGEFATSSDVFIVVGAHFPSGRSYIDELSRIQSLQCILDTIRVVRHYLIVLAGDTNTSHRHRPALTESAQQLFHKDNNVLISQLNATRVQCQLAPACAIDWTELQSQLIFFDDFFTSSSSVSDKFWNVVPDASEFYCFKMRHKFGEQKSKVGSVIYYSIDKVALLMPTRLGDSNVSVHVGSVTADRSNAITSSEHDLLLSTFVDGPAVEILRRICLGDALLEDQYNLASILSIGVNCTDTEIASEAWRDDMTANIKTLVPSLRDTLGSMFMKFFPNLQMPSDHPPIHVCITIS